MSIPILRTKLNRPPVAKDHLHRQHLLDWLDKRRQRPLTLVSAPAGYGKSTLVSCWLESCDCPSAWVSLDARDNGLQLFLAYFLAAVETMFPGAVPESQTLQKATDLPPLSSLAGTLINELNEIDQDFILVLDDYHMIHEKAVNDLIVELLIHPPDAMHLVVVSRRDPPFPILELRARGKMTEIRLQELRFSLAETTSFLQNVMETDVDPQTAAIIDEKTEGWVAGLRLAVLSFRERADLNRILAGLPDNNRYVIDYIVSEVVSQQPPDIKEYLLSTAVLDRFCAPLCEAICVDWNESKMCSLSGQTFIDQLVRNNMFIIPLDDRRRWYRFHHLFRQLLQREMNRHFKPETINELHNRAGSWFAHNDLPDEALQYLLAAGNIPAARQLVVMHRYDLTKHEQWHRLESWINAIPKESVNKDPELLIAIAWLHENRERIPEMLSVISRIERLLADGAIETTEKNGIIGELNALKAGNFYLSGDVRRAEEHANQAIAQIPRHHLSELAYALLVWAFTHQMSGDAKKAREVIYDALPSDETASSTYSARLLLTLSFIDWLEGDLSGLRHNAAQLLKLGHTYNLLESKTFGNYHLGLVSYYHAETETAREHLTAAVKIGQLVDPNTYIHGNCALSLSYQAADQPGKASEIAQTLIDYALQTQNTGLLQTVKAFNAELALRQGRISEAGHWAREYPSEPPGQAMRFFVPQMTRAKILLVQGTPTSRQEALGLLVRLNEFYKSVHNKHCLIEVLALKAMLHDATGDRPAALADLAEALILAHPSRRKQPFLDLGPKMAALLELLGHQKRFERYIGEILETFDRFTPSTLQNISNPKASHQPEPSLESPRKLDEKLTNREIDIVKLLSRRLSNKEIAEKLFISPETVKRHTVNIYRKLSVHDRQEAVAKAQDLGLL
jgi:LuxR family maltose regulon positive regulatory protein